MLLCPQVNLLLLPVNGKSINPPSSMKLLKASIAADLKLHYLNVPDSPGLEFHTKPRNTDPNIPTRSSPIALDPSYLSMSHTSQESPF